MKRLNIPALIAFMLSLSGCELIGGIFKAGVWVGVLVVVGILALIFFVIGRARK